MLVKAPPTPALAPPSAPAHLGSKERVSGVLCVRPAVWKPQQHRSLGAAGWEQELGTRPRCVHKPSARTLPTLCPCTTQGPPALLPAQPGRPRRPKRLPPLE